MPSVDETSSRAGKPAPGNSTKEILLEYRALVVSRAQAASVTASIAEAMLDQAVALKEHSEATIASCQDLLAKLDSELELLSSIGTTIADDDVAW